MWRTLILTSILTVLATASPVIDQHGSDRRDNLVRRGTKRCVVKSSGDDVDDTPAFQAAVTECSSDGVIVLQDGVDYNFFTPVTATGLSNVEIQWHGNAHLPRNISYVQNLVNAAPSAKIEWFTFAGNQVNFTGTRNVSTGWIDSYGEAWWEANPTNGSGLAGRPHLLSFNLTGGSYIKNLKDGDNVYSLGDNGRVTALAGNDITVENTLVDATTTGSFPFNTDGFDISGTNILIEDSVILNGDDAFTVNNGAENVTVRNALIGGPGCHGCSVGSLGSNAAVWNSVKNILFTDISVSNCVYAARFKSYAGGQGLVTNVTWENFKLTNVTFPIYVTQNYVNQAITTTSSNSTGTSNQTTENTVMMDGFTWRNWKGTINTYNPGDWSCVSDPCWYAVDGADGTQAAVIECSNSTSCSNYELDNIRVIPQSYDNPTIICSNVETNLNPAFGAVCQNGLF